MLEKREPLTLISLVCTACTLWHDLFAVFISIDTDLFEHTVGKIYLNHLKTNKANNFVYRYVNNNTTERSQLQNTSLSIDYIQDPNDITKRHLIKNNVNKRKIFLENTVSA